jgi:hypothetical protein
MTREFRAGRDVAMKEAMERLHDEFDGVHPTERIDGPFADSMQQIGGAASVESYVPTTAARPWRRRGGLRARAASSRSHRCTHDAAIMVGPWSRVRRPIEMMRPHRGAMRLARCPLCEQRRG